MRLSPGKNLPAASCQLPATLRAIFIGSMTFDVGKGNEYFFKVQSTVDICRK
jgi:hypothetical protein